MGELVVNADLAVGALLAGTRVAGFVIASPLTSAALPPVGRTVLIIALGWLLAEPVPASVDAITLVALGTVNFAVGAVLGMLTGLLFYLFPVAGSVIDMTSALGASRLIDPASGVQSTIFNRIFSMSALAAFYAIGGLTAIALGLASSVEALALDGSFGFDSAGLARTAVDLTARLTVAGFEVALPALSALLLVEITLGLASRFSPNTNVFLLGLPGKLLIAMLVVPVSLLLFPDMLAAVRSALLDLFETLPQALQPSP